MIGREEILTLVPHAGPMCLIERVLEWDEHSLRCQADNQREPGHPLRRQGGALAGVHLIEYGAQAAAVHGALLARDASRRRPAGMLVSARDCELYVDQLHELPGPLDIRARRELARPDGLIYSFEVAVADRRLALGRISILLAPEKSTNPYYAW